MAETNPHRILKSLDHNLVHAVELTLFGRAALALGFGQVLSEWGETLDIDIIVASHMSAPLEQDDQFWEAIEKTNAQLAPSGLYLSHIFDEEQLIIRPGWYTQKQPIDLPEIRKIVLYRFLHTRIEKFRMKGRVEIAIVILGLVFYSHIAARHRLPIDEFQ